MFKNVKKRTDLWYEKKINPDELEFSNIGEDQRR